MNKLTIPIHHKIVTLHYNALGKKLIELVRKNDKQLKDVFKILDNLVNDAKQTDTKVMGL